MFRLPKRWCKFLEGSILFEIASAIFTRYNEHKVVMDR